MEITDCKTVEEFAHKYRKFERFQAQGKEYVKKIIESHYEDIAINGYTSISRHDSVLGKHITFKPKQGTL